MKSVSVYDKKGKATGKFSLDQDYFNGKTNKDLLHQAALMYLSNQRRGSASTKTRAQVRGGGRKPWRQKGTGRARAGSIRSPIWKGGGVIFGPHPRQFTYSLPKKIKSLALRQSLNGKIKSNQFIIINNLSLNLPKAKELMAVLTALKAKERPLLVLEKHSPGILRAARNIPEVAVKTFNNINAFDVLKHKKVIFSKQAIENLIKLRKR
ncbi:MAG: 50S ribosomal protein L4 [Omnitrophica bacterium]|nr:50S ribosomal protein L4 [Candidatus Omnitrophota bacterium]